MAEAKKVTVLKQVVKEVYVEGVEIKLSMDEAKTLAAVLRRVGGSPDYIRGIADGIAEALRDAIGVWSADDSKDHLQGHLYFGDIRVSDLRKSSFY